MPEQNGLWNASGLKDILYMHFAEALKSAVNQIFPQPQSLETSMAFDHCKLLRGGMDCGVPVHLEKCFSFSFFFLKFFFEELVVAS